MIVSHAKPVRCFYSRLTNIFALSLLSHLNSEGVIIKIRSNYMKRYLLLKSTAGIWKAAARSIIVHTLASLRILDSLEHSHFMGGS